VSDWIGPSASVEDLERLMRARLNPMESYLSAATRAENELNPDWPRPAGPFHPAAVLVPLVEREEGVTVLLTRRSDSLKSHSGQVAFPGGRADPGETPWETALREAQEEIGLDRSFVRIVGLGDIFETVSGFSIMPVVAFVRSGFTVTPHEQEVAEVFETPFDFLMNPANHEMRSRDFGDGRQRHYYAMTHTDRLIWGVTAWMLRSLYQKLFAEGSPYEAGGPA
jgi:8-oxo-dGTP pyrophosphatase MutT (NUDIX family)